MQQLETIIGFAVIASMTFSLAVCFFGYRMFLFLIGVTGFLLFSIPTGWVVFWQSGELALALVSALFAGVLGAWLATTFYIIGVFFWGAATGILILLLIDFANAASLDLTVYVIAGIAGGFAAVMLQKIWIIISTALGGAAGALAGLVYFVPDIELSLGALSADERAHGVVLLIALAWLVLSVSGAAFQFQDAKTLSLSSRRAPPEQHRQAKNSDVNKKNSDPARAVALAEPEKIKKPGIITAKNSSANGVFGSNKLSASGILLVGLILISSITLLMGQQWHAKRNNTSYDALQSSILRAMIIDGEITQGCAERKPEQGDILTISSIDLGREDFPTYEVSGNTGCTCIGARRCAVWIYQKSSDGYQNILSGVQPDKGVTVLDSSTNGYADLEVVALAGDQSFREVFRFDGRQYQGSGFLPISEPVRITTAEPSLKFREPHEEARPENSDALRNAAIVNTPGDGFFALRSQPSISAGSRLAKIPHGTTLELGVCVTVSPGNRWCRTTYRGNNGWVFERFVDRPYVVQSEKADYLSDRSVSADTSGSPLPKAYTPQRGDPVRKAIMDAVRDEYSNKNVLFLVHYLKVSGDWAWTRVTGTLAGKPQYEPSAHLLNKAGSTWRVVDSLGLAGDCDELCFEQAYRNIILRFPRAPLVIFEDAPAVPGRSR